MASSLSVTPISKLETIPSVLSTDLLLLSRSQWNDSGDVQYYKSYKASIVDMSRTISTYLNTIYSVYGDLINNVCVDIHNISGDVLAAFKLMCNVHGDVYNNISTVVHDITGNLSNQTNLVLNIGTVSAVTNNVVTSVDNISAQSIEVVNNTNLSIDQISGYIENNVNTNINRINKQVVTLNNCCGEICVNLGIVDNSINNICTDFDLNVHSIIGPICTDISNAITNLTETSVTFLNTSCDKLCINVNALNNSTNSISNSVAISVDNLCGYIKNNVESEILNIYDNHITLINSSCDNLCIAISNLNKSQNNINTKVELSINNLCGEIANNICVDIRNIYNTHIANLCSTVENFDADIKNINQSYNSICTTMSTLVDTLSGKIKNVITSCDNLCISIENTINSLNNICVGISTEVKNLYNSTEFWTFTYDDVNTGETKKVKKTMIVLESEDIED